MDRALAALREHFGFAAFRPGQAEAVRAALAGRDAARRHADGRGQVALLPAAGAHARRPHGRRLAARVAHAGPGRGARARGAGARGARQRPAGPGARTAPRSRARRRARCSCCTSRRSGSRRRGSSRRCATSRSGCSSSTRRTASRSGATTSGPTTSASPTPRAGSARGRSSPRPRPRRRRSRRTSSARLGLRDPVRVTTGFDRPNLSFAVVPCRGPADKRARLAAALAEPAARPAIVYAGTRADTERICRRPRRRARESRSSPTTRASGASSARDAQRRFMAGEVEVVVATNAFGMGVDKADVRTVAHATRARVGRGLLPGGGPRRPRRRAGRARCCSPRRATRACTCSSSSAPRSTTRPLADGRASAARARRSDGRYDAGGSFDVGIGDLGDEPERVRAIVGHLARAGVVRAGAVADRSPARASCAAPFDGRARAACRASAGEAQRARWRQYRAVWAFVEGGACRRATILRHFGDRAAPRAVGAVLRRLRPGARPGRRSAPRAARRPAAGAARPRVDLDAAILDVVTAAEPVGRAHADGRDPPRRALAGRPASTPTTACPPTARSRTCAPTRCSRASTSCSPPGGWCRPAAPTRSSASRRRGRHEGRRPRLGGGHEPPGAAGHASTAASVEVVAVASDQPRRAGARARRAAPAWRRGSSRAATSRDRAGARRRDRRLARGARRRASSCSPATWRSSTPPSSPASPGGSSTSTRRCCRPSPACARSSRRSDYGVEGLRRDRPLRRRGRRHRADRPAGGGRGCRTRAIAGGRAGGVRPLEHELLPRAVALIAAGAVRRDPGHPRRVLVEPGRWGLKSSSSSSSASGSSNPSGSPPPSSSSSQSSSSSLSTGRRPRVRASGLLVERRRCRRRACRCAPRARRRCVRARARGRSCGVPSNASGGALRVCR